MIKPNKEKDKKPQKQYFDVVVECDVPAVMTYRILAENPEEAVKIAQNKSLAPNAIKYQPVRRKDFKIVVKDAGTFLVRLTLSLWGK